ncbi:MAG: SUMF1/EgtB/PvdO family nonheme iron enzyme [bacterium]|nr:SUMF1/EgtB/PvdO family nonheme iron enzyme [bacterium]
MLDSFYIDTFEVSNRLYLECVETGNCLSPKNKTLVGPTYRESIADPSVPEKTFVIEDYFGGNQYLDYPVVNVNWEMAKSYCDWRDAKLPTEAEWEKAARGSDGRIYPWGNNFSCGIGNHFNFIFTGNWFYINNNIPKDSGKAISWYMPSVCDQHYGTSPIGAYPRNISPFGAFDMSGNVWEWVSSLYSPYPYDEFDVEKDEKDGKRVFRGGSFLSFDSSARSVTRQSAVINYSAPDLGFRCAKDAP